VDTDNTRSQNVKPTSVPGDDWQRLWFSTREHAWSSLAIIPSDGGVEVGRVAEALVATGRLHGERQVRLLDAKGTQLGDVHRLIDELGVMTGRGDWVIVPVDAIEVNPSSVPIAQATSASLLVVRLGESLLTSARNAIEVVGRERLLGSIVLGGRGRGPGKLIVTVLALALVCARFLIV
jgi:hypothetical protein